MSKTRLSKTGQPVMNTTIECDTVDGWVAARVVGKLFGSGGNADLVALIVEYADDGTRERVRSDVGWRCIA